MADPLTILSVIEGSLGLIVQCGGIIKTLHDIAGKFKQLDLTIMSMTQELETIEFAWTRIKDWSQAYVEEATDLRGSENLDRCFLDRLHRSLTCGTIVMSALQDDLNESVGGKSSQGLTQRAKLAWNAKAFEDHQDRIRGQTAAMSLMLQVLDLQTPKGRSKLVKAQKRQYSKSDESAYSIVPSRMSSRHSSRLSRSSRNVRNRMSVASADLAYRQLSFEDDLFTGPVYKRNFKKFLIGSVSQSKASGDETFTETKTTVSSQIEKAPFERSIRRSLSTTGVTEPLSPTVSATYTTSELNIALEKAVHLGRQDHMRVLLDHGAQINHRMSYKDSTPLHAAIKAGDHQMTQLLINLGADIHCKTSEGLQPIDLALAGHCWNTVRTLRNAGASSDYGLGLFELPLHCLATSPDQSQMIELSVASGAAVSLEDEAGWTALDVACEFRQCLNFRTLLRLGATASRSTFQTICFGEDSWPEYPEILYDVLEYDPNFRCSRTFETIPMVSFFRSPFTLAGVTKLLQVCHLLGTDFQAQDNTGNQVFHHLARSWGQNKWCYQRNDEIVMNDLLTYGADINATNRHGETPLYLVSQNLPQMKLYREKGAEPLSDELYKRFMDSYPPFASSPMHSYYHNLLFGVRDPSEEMDAESGISITGKPSREDLASEAIWTSDARRRKAEKEK